MQKRNKGIIALAIAALLSVVQGVIARQLSNEFTLLQQVYTRIGIAFLFGLLLFNRYLQPAKLKKISHKEWTLLVSRSALGFLFGALLWVSGFSIAKLANASFIDAIPMSSVLAFLILREHISVTKIFWIVLTFLGALFISVKDFSSLSGWGQGELLVLASTFFFALRNISRTWHTKLLNNQEISMFQFFFGFLMLLSISLFLGETWSPNVHPYAWALTLLGGLFNVGLLYLSNYGFEHVESSIAGVTLAIGSVFGLGLGYFFYTEIPTTRELLGGMLIVLSIIAMSRIKEKKRADAIIPA